MCYYDFHHVYLTPTYHFPHNYNQKAFDFVNEMENKGAQENIEDSKSDSSY